MPLDTTPRLDDPDGLFAALVDAHQGLDPAISRQLDAALVLLLANHIGETAIVFEAIAAARALAPAHALGRHQQQAESLTTNPGGQT
jgi:uncharacterized protein DUF2783